MKFLRESIDQIENGNGKVHELKENPRNIVYVKLDSL